MPKSMAERQQKFRAKHPPSTFVQLPAHIKHGTAAGYKNYRCRCTVCREYNKLQMRRLREHGSK